MQTVYSDRHRLQDGQAELIDGKLVKCFECPERADIVLARVRDRAIGPVIEPTEHGLGPVRRVHTAISHPSRRFRMPGTDRKRGRWTSTPDITSNRAAGGRKPGRNPCRTDARTPAG